MLRLCRGEGAPQVKSTILFTSFNMVNSIVGSGVIGMPYAMATCGLPAGILLLTLVASITACTMQMIVSCGVKLGALDYEAVMASFGPRGRLAVLASMVLLTTGAMISYVVIIGDTVGTIVAEERPSQGSRAAIIAVFSSTIVLPLCLLRDMAMLSSSSFLSLLAEVLLVLIVAGAAPGSAREQGITESGADDPYAFARMVTLPKGLGVISFAFVCQHSCFIIRNSLIDPTPARWATVSVRSVFASWCICMAMALVGYLNFFDAVSGDVLNTFTDTDPAANAARALLAVTMVFTFPMESFVLRKAVFELFFADGGADAKARQSMLLTASALSLEDGMDAADGASGAASGGKDALAGAPVAADGEYIPNRIFYPLTVALWLVATAVGMATSDLGAVLSVTGAIGGSLLAFIMPAALYWRTFADEISALQKALLAALVLFGALALVSGVVAVVADA